MAEPPLTRPSLLRRLQADAPQRDDRAWAEFLELYEPLLMRLMRRRGLQDCDARDATQQVLLRISRAIPKYQPDGALASFRRWLFRVARNVAVTHLARESRTGQIPRARDFENIDSAGIPAELESEEFEKEYRQQLLAWGIAQIQHEFRPATWSAFLETCIHGRPIPEVASELGMSPGNVYVARSRVISRLRAKVEEFEARS
jgi:RNA polymerase sigma factor (sigma-70 family)